jgi:alpha-aminoadipic semialdehyde synthase
MQNFKDVGLLESNHKFSITTWGDLLRNTLSIVTGTTLRAGDEASLWAVVSDLLGSQAGYANRVLSETGLVSVNGTRSSQSGTDAIPIYEQTALEHFAHLLSTQLSYKAGERDMVVLSHEIKSQPKDLNSVKSQDETLYSSSLFVTGTRTGESAMSRTVGLPLAFATLEVLDDKVESRGVLGGKEMCVGWDGTSRYSYARVSLLYPTNKFGLLKNNSWTFAKNSLTNM